eukprot:5761000-Amphidinium_carterae.1
MGSDGGLVVLVGRGSRVQRRGFATWPLVSAQKEGQIRMSRLLVAESDSASLRFSFWKFWKDLSI